MNEMKSFFSTHLMDSDPDLFSSLDQELTRQRDGIELIASENIVSKAVLEAQGSVFTNKYAEGYLDVDTMADVNLLMLLNSLRLTVSNSSMVLNGPMFSRILGLRQTRVFFLALLQPGDTILGMSLAAGGHLTHGAGPNLSGKWFNAVQYGVRPDDARIDFDEVQRLADEHKPKMIIAGGLHILVFLILRNSERSQIAVVLI